MIEKRRIVAWILTIMMVFQMMPTSALGLEGWSTFSSDPYSGAIYYKVTFQNEGSSDIVQYVQEGGNPVMPEDPSKTGQKFDGWYLINEQGAFMTQTDSKTGKLERIKVTEATVVEGDLIAKSVFTPIAQYSVTVKYVNEANEQVADSVVRQYSSEDTEIDTITSPAFVAGGNGYLYPDRAAVTIDPQTLTVAETTETVTYRAADMTYTVHHRV